MYRGRSIKKDAKPANRNNGYFYTPLYSTSFFESTPRLPLMSRENNDETINGHTIVDLNNISPYTRVYRRFVRFKSVGDVKRLYNWIQRPHVVCDNYFGRQNTYTRLKLRLWFVGSNNNNNKTTQRDFNESLNITIKPLSVWNAPRALSVRTIKTRHVHERKEAFQFFEHTINTRCKEKYVTVIKTCTLKKKLIIIIITFFKSYPSPIDYRRGRKLFPSSLGWKNTQKHSLYAGPMSVRVGSVFVQAHH